MHQLLLQCFSKQRIFQPENSAGVTGGFRISLREINLWEALGPKKGVTFKTCHFCGCLPLPATGGCSLASLKDEEGKSLSLTQTQYYLKDVGTVNISH